MGCGKEEEEDRIFGKNLVDEENKNRRKRGWKWGMCGLGGLMRGFFFLMEMEMEMEMGKRGEIGGKKHEKSGFCGEDFWES